MIKIDDFHQVVFDLIMSFKILNIFLQLIEQLT